MTSEVLMLNKDAVVIAADSAVTSGTKPHPRYSKSANKIFDISVHGNVAVTIYATGEIDRVPWELALKQFRKFDAPNPQRHNLEEYIAALVSYLETNSALFPANIRADLLKRRIAHSAANVLTQIGEAFPDFINKSAPPASRIAAWQSGEAAFARDLAPKQCQAPLTDADLASLKGQSKNLEAYLAPLVAADPDYAYADASKLTELAIENIVKRPKEFLNSSGLVFAGYGAGEIFPSFFQTRMFGHVGEKFLWIKEHDYAISHDNDAWIQPFAQSSMIDRFTDGFDSDLNAIIYRGSWTTFSSIVSDLKTAGIPIPDNVSNPILNTRHEEFMKNWKSANWKANFHPLRRVLNSLSVPEMGHLAESLLVLEALRERVTSPSESVGGPIDVAAITKAEGLLWLKRKHFFDPQLNLRYMNRVKSS